MAEVTPAAAVNGGVSPKGGVSSLHPDYSRMMVKWQRCRDVMAGQDAVHAGGEKYLPKLTDQSTTAYDAYNLRAPFYNASWRTVTGLNGMLFRKPPVVKAVDSVLALFEDVTMSGVPLQMFAQTVSEEALKIGRVGVLVDYPPAPAEGLTKADATAMNLRPTLAMYQAESIINWRTRTIGNKHVLAMVVLCEQQELQVDEFKVGYAKKYRVLDLFEQKNEKTGLVEITYRVRIFSINAQGADVLESASIPLMDNKPLTFIPFVFLGTDDVTAEVDDPPLIDLVDTNLSHYRTAADYEHGCHFTGLPTAVVSGWEAPAPAVPGGPVEKLYIGSATAWTFPNPLATAKYLEFTGQGLSSLKENLERKEQQMAVLGARMLEALKKGVESAQTASIHRVGEQSMLASVAQTISLGLTRALGWFSQWAGNADGEASIDLNRDFFPVPMTDAMLKALIAGWQSGAYSYETLFDNLKQGEVIAQDADFEDEQAKIANDPPVLNGGAPTDGGTGGSGDPAASTPTPAAPQTIIIKIPRGTGKRTVTGPGGQKYVIEESE